MYCMGVPVGLREATRPRGLRRSEWDGGCPGLDALDRHPGASRDPLSRRSKIKMDPGLRRDDGRSEVRRSSLELSAKRGLNATACGRKPPSTLHFAFCP